MAMEAGLQVGRQSYTTITVAYAPPEKVEKSKLFKAVARSSGSGSLVAANHPIRTTNEDEQQNLLANQFLASKSLLGNQWLLECLDRI